MTSQTTEHLPAIIGANIRLARDTKVMSQRELAGAADVSEMQVSRWERGVGAPNHENLIKLAVALEQETGWFYVERRPGA